MRTHVGPQLDAVLFDAGGTLLSLDFAFMARTAAEAGVQLEPRAIARAEAEARRDVDRQASGGVALRRDRERLSAYFERLLVAAGASARRAAGIARSLEAHHEEELLWRVPIEGARPTLAGLRASGLRVGVVSNSDGRVEDGLRRAGLRDLVELVVDSHVEGVEKPAPDIFRRALVRLGVEARRTIYVGDIFSVDAVGARQAGLAPLILDETGDYAGHDCPTVPNLASLLRADVLRHALGRRR
jgi:putative hydrolase of the HAD superfamily